MRFLTSDALCRKLFFSHFSHMAVSAIVFLCGALRPALIFHWIIARSDLVGVVGEIYVEICFSREEEVIH